MKLTSKTCKTCGEEKHIYKFIMNRGRYTNTCKECRNAYLRSKYVKKRPVCTDEKILERRRKDVEHKRKIKEEKDLLEKSWADELYEYVEAKNIFKVEELEVIYEWLKMVDYLG